MVLFINLTDPMEARHLRMGKWETHLRNQNFSKVEAADSRVAG